MPDFLFILFGIVFRLLTIPFLLFLDLFRLLIIPSAHGDPKEAVLTHMAKHVKVQGLTYVAGGLRSLEVTEVDELD